MRDIDTVVIGGGQAGLAMSRCLTDASVEHVVLERGRVGERWRSERWDSLHLLTPRWLSRLPGGPAAQGDPDGFMHKDELVGWLEAYSRSFGAPLRTGVTVTALEAHPRGYRVETDTGAWTARRVVVATGACHEASVPPVAQALPAAVRQVVPTDYRSPDGLEPGGVLVVGASATGIQLAAEVHASGRPVTLAVGRHTRLPRRYRGRDIFRWLHAMGVLDERADDVHDLETSRDQPSLQLVGGRPARTLDLGLLQEAGVRLAGRLVDADGRRVGFDDDLVETTAAADLKLAKLRMRIDEHIRRRGLDREVGPEEPFRPVRPHDAPTELDLEAEGIRTVVWATGFRRSYPWIRVPVLDARGEIRHRGGVCPRPGLYVLGLGFLRRRSSSFIDGAGRDARELARHLVAHRADTRRGAA